MKYFLGISWSNDPEPNEGSVKIGKRISRPYPGSRAYFFKLDHDNALKSPVFMPKSISKDAPRASQPRFFPKKCAESVFPDCPSTTFFPKYFMREERKNEKEKKIFFRLSIRFYCRDQRPSKH